MKVRVKTRTDIEKLMGKKTLTNAELSRIVRKSSYNNMCDFVSECVESMIVSKDENKAPDYELGRLFYEFIEDLIYYGLVPDASIFKKAGLALTPDDIDRLANSFHGWLMRYTKMKPKQDMKNDEEKLNTLVKNEGYSDWMELIKEVAADCVVPGICTNEDCSYSTGVEPDSGDGFCENCGTGTVKSCLLLARII